MKKLLTLFILLLSISLTAQRNYSVITIDSFTSNALNQGVYSLTAVEHNGAVHLAYFYGSEQQEWFLIYEVRDEGRRISREEVVKYGSPPWLGASTSIQFDADGDPHIYCSMVVNSNTQTKVYSKKGRWITTDMDYKGKITWLSSSVDGSRNMGFVTWKNNIGFPSERIEYFSFEDEVWTTQTVTQTNILKTPPQAFHAGDETYIGYAELHFPDTLILYVQRRLGDTWIPDLKKIYTGADFGGSLWIRFGQNKGDIHLLHSLEKPSGASLTHLVRSQGAWETLDFENGMDYAGTGISGQEIEFDTKGNMFWQNGDALRWIDYNNVYDDELGPLKGAYYSYLDFVVIGEEIYIYIKTGNRSGSDPVMFYEARANLNTLTDVGNIPSGIRSVKLFPNPGSGEYWLNVSSTDQADMHIEWLDANGRSIDRNQVVRLDNGDNRIPLRLDTWNKGMFFLRILVNGQQMTLPVLQL